MPSSRVLVFETGASHVACGVFLVGKGPQLELTRYAVETFESETSDDVRWERLTAQSLAAITRDPKLRGDCVLGLPGHLTLTKFIKAPAVEASKRDKIIQFEAQQGIPYPLGEVVWDHFTVADDGLDLEVMLAAVKREAIGGLCAVSIGAGLAPAKVAPSSLALCHAYRLAHPSRTEATLVIDIGARSSTFLFVEGERFSVRTLPLAGNTVTQAIADEIGQPFARAEALKIQMLSGEVELAEASPARRAVEQAVKNFATRMHQEISRSTVNYRRQSGGEAPSLILLTGGGALIDGLHAALEEKTGTKVAALDVLEGVIVGPEAELARKDGARLAALVGLAIEATQAKGLNLLPPELVARREFLRRQPWMLGAAALVVLGLALPILQAQRIGDAAKRETAELEARMRPLRAVRARDDENLARIEAARKEVDGLRSLVETKSNWINFFGDLQARLTQVEDVWLDRLEVLRPAAPVTTPAPEAASGEEVVAAPAPVLRLQLSGRLVDKNNPVSKVSQDSYTRVKSLLAGFADSAFIAAVESERFDASQPGVLRFDFTLVVDPGHPL